LWFLALVKVAYVKIARELEGGIKAFREGIQKDEQE
jgi:hypothetical protein